MGILNFLSKKEYLLSIDIGSTSVKMLELDFSGGRPRISNLGFSAVGADVFSGNTLARGEKVAEQISALVESNAIADKRAVTAVPGPSVFTKRVKMPKQAPADLRDSLMLEAANFIPHSLDAVRLDYHIIGESGKSQLDVLVVAVKNEIIDGFTECLSLAGLETAVVDVDFFALQNVFELAYPELVEKTVALVNVGARYSAINICRNGDSLFTGDISVGGKLFSDALAEGLGLPFSEAEELKKKPRDAAKTSAEEILNDSAQDIIDRNIEYMATEFNRQLSFFWNAAGADEAIDLIMLTGGGSSIAGLCEVLSEKTGLECKLMEPLRGLEWDDSVDESHLQNLAPMLAISIGMAIRQPGDRVIPDIF